MSKQTPSILLITGVIIIALLLIFFLPNANKDNPSKNTNTTSSNTPIPTQNTLGNIFRIGEQVNINGLTWTVTEATELGTALKPLPEYQKDSPGCKANKGKFIYIKFTIKNTSSNSLSGPLQVDTTLYDGNNHAFSNDFQSATTYECIKGANENIIKELKPGAEITIIQVFDVPKDSKNLKLQLPDLVNEKDTQNFVDLGI